MIAAIIPIGIGGLVFFALWLWAVLDCIATDTTLVRNLPKQTWIFVVVFVPTAGALAWLLLGRPEGAGFSVGGKYRPADYRTGPRVRGFEDSAAWDAQKDHIKPVASSKSMSESAAVRERRLQEWEAELAAREAALSDTGDTETPDEAE